MAYLSLYLSPYLSQTAPLFMFDALPAALIAGLASGLHCTAMCGGIAGTHGARAVPRSQPVSVLPRGTVAASPLSRNIAFNLGRISSYTLAGALVGSAAGATLAMSDSMPLRQALFIAANLMLVMTGLQVAGVSAMAPLERVGARLWRHLQPHAARLAAGAAHSARQSLAMGALWGWIPCGLVYAMLATAMAQGNSMESAAVMLAFGLGTLPNLLAIGWAGTRANAWLVHPLVRALAGGGIAVMGVVGLLRLPALSQLDAWGALCRVLPA